jgi:hypothetical protein
MGPGIQLRALPRTGRLGIVLQVSHRQHHESCGSPRGTQREPMPLWMTRIKEVPLEAGTSHHEKTVPLVFSCNRGTT